MAEQDGVQVCIQTDHRSPAEMDETAELSVLFALVRTLGPRRFATDSAPAPKVKYAAMQGASEGVAEAVAAAGAALETMAAGTPELVVYPGSPRPVATLVDEAFRGLAHRVALRESVAVSPIGLKAFEDRILADAWDLEDGEQEIEAWTAAVELAALTGECIRQVHGGRWVLTEEALNGAMGAHISAADFGLLPFAYARETGELHNAANKAIRAMSEPGQSVLQMLVTESSAAQEDGKMMVILKPADWGTHGVVSRPLFETLTDGPLVVVGKDMPNSVAYSAADERSPEEIDAVFTEALANLAEVQVEVERLDLDVPMDIYVVHGDFYAAEKILDESFMHSMHARVGQELLAVSVPVRGRMFVTAGAQAPENIARMLALAQGVFDGEPEPISPRVFGVMNGKIAAIVQASPESEPPEKKKGLWRRLFGG